MQIVNQRQRVQSRTRFWVTYVLSLLLVAAAAYWAARMPEIESAGKDGELARMRNRDRMWKELAIAANNLSTIRDLEVRTPGGYPNLSGADLVKVNQLEPQFQQITQNLTVACLQDTTTYKHILACVRGLQAFHATIKRARKDDMGNADANQIKAEYEREISDLERELDNTKMQLQMMMLKGSGGGGSGATGGGGAGMPAAPTPNNCMPIEMERKKLEQKYNAARGLAMEIINKADMIAATADKIKRDKTEKDAIRAQTTEISGKARQIVNL